MQQCKKILFVGEQADFMRAKLKKNICKTFYRLKM